MDHKLNGTVIPVPAFFNNDLSLDLQELNNYISFLTEKGGNIFYCALSASQLEFMTNNERCEFISTVSKAAKKINPKAIVLGQAVGGNWITDMIEESKILQNESGADIVVIKPQEPRFGSNFFSSKYNHFSYKEERHDEYYYNYLLQINKNQIPFIFHDRPLAPGKSLGLKTQKRISDMTYCMGIKVHNPDLLSMNSQYQLLSQKTSMFDGFGKILQFWSIQWGATARHSCWSWFDIENDLKFFPAVKNKEFDFANYLISRELELLR